MVYLFETYLDNKKTVLSSIIKIFGISWSTSLTICKKLGFSKNLTISELSEEQLNHFIKLIENSNFKINHNLKLDKKIAIQNLIKIKSYKGLRRSYRLPVRGQRTHTNSKTSKKLFK